jgi:hypothetical protein
VLDFTARLLVGTGINYYLAEKDRKTGKLIKDYQTLPEVEAFIKNSQINRLYLMEAASDLVWFNNIFPELGTSIDGKYIVRLVEQEAMFCRFAVMNEQQVIDQAFISAKWPNPKHDEVAKVPVIDPYDIHRVEKLRKRAPGNYIYPVSMPSPGSTYYQASPWDSARSSKWLKYSLQIPELKAAIVENAMNIKYHIRIPIAYWEWRYDGFMSKDDNERADIISRDVNAFVDAFTGSDKAGKMVSTPYFTDPATGKEYGKWEVEVLKSDFGDNLFNEDSVEASSHLLMALGIHRSLINSPGKGLGSGSGSDARVHFNITNAMMWSKRESLLAPLYFVSEYNMWPANLKFEIMGHDEIQTLNTGSETISVTEKQDNAVN